MPEALKDGIVYVPSPDIVVREIDGEIIIVPLTAEVAGPENALFSLNHTGRAMWKRLDGRKPLGVIASELASEFGTSLEIVERGVRNLAAELAQRKLILPVPGP